MGTDRYGNFVAPMDFAMGRDNGPVPQPGAKKSDGVTKHKIPQKGETVLVFDESKTDDAYDQYRRKVLAAGGRVRRAVGIESFRRHLQVYTPTFIVYLADRV